ncbi:hypothetical protein HOD08_00460 [bacterium]|nr:hypothetical protein [bacterium]
MQKKNALLLMLTCAIVQSVSAGKIMDCACEKDAIEAVKYIVRVVEDVQKSWSEKVDTSHGFNFLMEEVFYFPLREAGVSDHMPQPWACYFYGRAQEVCDDLLLIKNLSKNDEGMEGVHNGITKALVFFTRGWDMFFKQLVEQVPEVVGSNAACFTSPNESGPNSVLLAISEIIKRSLEMGNDDCLNRIFSFLSSHKAFARNFDVDSVEDKYTEEFEAIFEIGKIVEMFMNQQQVETVIKLVKEDLFHLDNAIALVMRRERYKQGLG